MQVTAISDLHGNLPTIGECDLLLIAGDLSPIDIQRDHLQMWVWIFDKFLPWVENIPCNTVVFTPGNHDFWFEKYQHLCDALENASFRKLKILIDEEYTHYELGIDPISNQLTNIPYKIYGSPRVKYCGKWAFTHMESILEDYYDKIPEDVDILLTHMPPKGKHTIGADPVPNTTDYIEYGSESLASAIDKVKPKYVVCGHIHDGNHNPTKIGDTTYINCSMLNNDYEVHYKPQTFEI